MRGLMFNIVLWIVFGSLITIILLFATTSILKHTKNTSLSAISSISAYIRTLFIRFSFNLGLFKFSPSEFILRELGLAPPFFRYSYQTEPYFSGDILGKSLKINNKETKEFVYTTLTEIAACWTRYKNYDFAFESYENPVLCSIVSGEVKDFNMSLFFEASKSAIIREVPDCTMGCEEGYSCLEKDKTKCYKKEYNPFVCMQYLEKNYNPCSEGSFKIVDQSLALEITINNSWGCLNYGTNWLQINDSEKCSRFGTDICCLSVDGSLEPIQIPNFLKKGDNYGFCYNNEAYSLPKPCYIIKDAPNKKPITFFDKLGLPIFYAVYDNNIYGSDKINPYDDPTYIDSTYSGKLKAYIYYLDDFTNTTLPPQRIVLPEECGNKVFVSSCSSCLNTCFFGMGELFVLKGMVKSTYGLIILTSLGSYYVTTGTKPNPYIAGCLYCLMDNVYNLFNQPDLVSCHDTIMVCFKKG